MATAIPQKVLSTFRCTEEVASTTSRPSKNSYPPVSSIPRTSPSRLAAAAESTDSNPDAPATAPTTVLYLAYGSNLSAETFLGARGIRPVSQVNVSAPSLTLVFDLPGLPYREPCFANTAPRKIPKLPDPTDPPKFPPVPPVLPPPRPLAAEDELPTTPDLGWDKGLFGVVYEVTPEDYATIMATEGGGSSYKDILVPCIPLPPRVSVPEKPPIDIPRPFLAHTLYSPAIPDAEPEEPGRGRGDGGDGDTPSDPRKKWYWRFLRPTRRPDPAYAQPSARYLKLITDGAAEHELPDDYQRWLNGLQPYTVTTRRQRVAQWLLTVFFMPAMLLYFVLNKLVANKDGKVPLWLGLGIGILFNVLWIVYDGVLKPVFGDGERTQEDDEGGEGRRARRGLLRRRPAYVDEEKVGLLGDSEY
ncbi:hypothetical protein EsH8_VI_000189 [Colletotrichum jinshuiense]